MPELLAPKRDPPVGALYHLILPALAVALILNVPVPHLEAPVEAVIVGLLQLEQ